MKTLYSQPNIPIVVPGDGEMMPHQWWDEELDANTPLKHVTKPMMFGFFSKML